MAKPVRINEEERPLLDGMGVQSIKDLRSSIRALVAENGRLRNESSETLENIKNEKRKHLLRLLDFKDSVERVLDYNQKKSNPKDQQHVAMLRNFKSVFGMLEDILEEEGLRKIEFPSGKASVAHCKVVGTEEQISVDDATIVQTIEEGYYWRNELLRKASVIIVKNKEKKNG